MKSNSVNKRSLGVVLLGLLFTITQNVHAIEGLQISLQCSNVVLSWPSIEGQNYIVQYRQTLSATDSWQTLTSQWPAESGTNVTLFVHSNIVQNPCNCGGNGSHSALMAGPNMAMSAAVPVQIGPMVIPADGSGAPLPLAIYPPCVDLSGYLIYDPLTGETVSGAGYSRQTLSPLTTQATGLQTLNGNSRFPMDGPDPGPGGGGGGGTTQAPETGFYRVVQDGVQIWGSSLTNLINGALSDTVNIKFEAGNADPNNGTNLLGTLDSAVLLVDGLQFPGDGVLSAPANGSPLQFAMDTGYLENGDHTIALEVMWENPDTADPQNAFFTRYSDAVTITVSNTIYYPQWEPEIGELNISAYFAKTTCTNANWSIDIYDASSNHINTLTGYTTDGTITAYWNMMDTNGVARTNADVDPYFDSIITVGDPVTKKTPRKNQRRKDWPDHGVWTIAYQDDFRYYYDDGGYKKGSINSFAQTAQKYGGYYLYYPQPGQTNDIGQTYPVRMIYSNHTNPPVTTTQVALDHAMLLAMLSNTNSRNFYISAHGSATTMAGGFPSSDVQKHVKHRYRFVYLDGCETAKGNWDKAFGINGPGQFDISYYQSTGIRPAAFCGYDRETPYTTGSGQRTVNGVTYDDTMAWQVGGFNINFLFYWDLQHYGLSSAFYYGGLPLPPIRGWYPGTGLQIYGYSSMGVDEDNHKTDWQ